MKKILNIFTVFTLIGCLVGCGSSSDRKNTVEKVSESKTDTSLNEMEAETGNGNAAATDEIAVNEGDIVTLQVAGDCISGD